MVATQNYNVNDKVIMKKTHACGANTWEVMRVGADIKIKCIGCARIVMMTRREFNKRLKTVL